MGLVRRDVVRILFRLILSILIPQHVAFFVRRGKTGNSCVDNMSGGDFHVDLYSNSDGEVSTGKGGDTSVVNAPRSPTAFDPSRGDTEIWITYDGEMKAGSGRRKLCADATYAEILSCLKAMDNPRSPYNPITNNCRQDINKKTISCCLSGFSETSTR